MDGILLACLDSLKAEVAKVKDFKSRACLTNFIDICGALYTCEADDESMGLDVANACRSNIYEVHKKSNRLVEVLMSSEKLQKRYNIDDVLIKTQELLTISDKLNGKARDVPSSTAAAVTGDWNKQVHGSVLDTKRCQTSKLASMMNQSLLEYENYSKNAKQPMHSPKSVIIPTKIMTSRITRPAIEQPTKHRLDKYLNENTSMNRCSHASPKQKRSAKGKKVLNHKAKNKNNTEEMVQVIVGGLKELEDAAIQIQKAEQEQTAVHKKLTLRLEALKQEAGSHPAIDVYTARNCYTALAAKARFSEYTQYASAMERVLKKMRRAIETLESCNQNELENLSKQLPTLRTLSGALAVLHDTALSASGQTEDPALSSGAAGTLSLVASGRVSVLGEKPSYGQLVKGHQEGTVPLVERLSKTVTSIGNIHSSVEVSLDHVDQVLMETASDLGKKGWRISNPNSREEGLVGNYVDDASKSTTSGGAKITEPNWKNGSTEVCTHPDWVNTDGIDMEPLSFLCKKDNREYQSASDILATLPLGDKECREHLLGGTRLLVAAVDNLSCAARARADVLSARRVVDSALCRPFPETSILRLELIQLLTPFEDGGFSSPLTAPVADSKKACTGKKLRPDSPRKKNTEKSKLRSPELEVEECLDV